MWRFLRNLFYRVSLSDHSYKFLFESGPPDEVVVIDCETTGLNPRRDEILAVAAIRVKDTRILTSEAFYTIMRPDKAPPKASIEIHQLRAQDVAQGRAVHTVIPELLHFIGGRTIVGYFVEFDVAMIDRYVLPFISAKLPNKTIDISSIYYDLKYKNAPFGTTHDLRFASIMSDLRLPTLSQHDAFNDALMTAMMYVELRDMQRRGVRISRSAAAVHDLMAGA